MVGEVRYWNADGVLISTAEHRDGKPHGIARRYYRTGEIAQDSRYVDGVIHGERTYVRPSDPAITADGQLARLSTVITTHVCHYEHGDLVGQVYFDAQGTELDSNARPMRPRPPGVPSTAWYHDGWHWSRSAGETGGNWIESREYYDSGILRRERDHRAGTERGYHDNGALRIFGQRATGASHHLIGTWRHYARDGRPVLVATYDDEQAGRRETYRVWHRDGMTREGAVDGGLEVGRWTVKDAQGETIATWDLGARVGNLIDHDVCADELDDRYQPALQDRSLPAMIARARRAGITGNLDELGLDPAPPWLAISEDDDGRPVPLDHRRSAGLGTFVHALRWGPPDGARLANIAAALFRGGRAAAALDIIDAALAVAAEPRWAIARASYLRALGRDQEADAAFARPEKLDDRALELLAEIRANPDDDAPRLVFADHVSGPFPEHAALIVAQCTSHDDTEQLRALRAALPAWLRDEAFVRGFVEGLFYCDAEPFVTCDLDLLYRLGPTCVRLDLTDARDHIATLVTLAGMRRYRELSFADTSLGPLQIEQLGSCVYFDNLEYLGLHGTGLGDEDLEQLAEATGLPKLTALNLNYSREDMDYTLAGVRALVGASFAPRLESLDIAGRWLGDELLDVLEQFPALVHLDLSRNRLTDLSALRLATWPRPLQSLRVAGNDFGDDAKRALVLVLGERVRFD